MSKKTILTVDDEEHILELLKYNLESNGFDILQANTGEKALDIIGSKKIDLILLDLMLPGMDGIQILKIIRNNKKIKKIPVILLTAKNNEIDTVLGLEMGADDYIGKPFGVHELLARIKAVLRRIEEGSPEEETMDEMIEINQLHINKTNHTVQIQDQTFELPLKEFELLYLLAKNRGRVFSREYLLEKIWGYDYYGETRTVDVHIRNLRKKIEVDDKNPVYIKTVRGVGYKFIEKGQW
ncbi:two-component system alkaline phosphatase synthesis response regulator PhoP [Natranaerovirga hydrolytica]|uniref:Stage 0 sporulation protein A homolog n=1 Tax=Natranaerovirga hydrolytica TaxID=680378 RepID=A0A4R1N1F2_9FIRM|nr:response regulator transcription factor [Natranaerovirga hydrolytica]TCK98780.1 two-component system alkaline phosphatase synthesis response regulator PhoP [Natranaerovirga hydrolytica]